MSSLTILGDTSGSVVLQAPAVSGSTTITMAAQSGTLNVGGPTFAATMSSATTLSAGTWTKIGYNQKLWDTGSYYDATTNYRFTPLVAGYYQVNASISFTSPTIANPAFSIWKNNNEYIRGASSGVSAQYLYVSVSGIVYLNGSTDYIEIFQYNNTGGTIASQSGGGGATSPVMIFQAIWVRGA
jgi:hypothetical protein